MNHEDNNYDNLMKILNSSKEFDFKNGHILVIKEYYGNKQIALDLSKLNEDMVEEIFVDLDKIDEFEEEYDF